MVKFFCFPAHVSCHKPKKAFQHSAECMRKTRDPVDLSSKGSRSSRVSDAIHASSTKHQRAGNRGEKLGRSSSFDMLTTSLVMPFHAKVVDGSCCKLEGTISGSKNAETLSALCLKKSKSLCSELDKEGKVSNFLDGEDEADQGLPCGDVPGNVLHNPSGCNYLSDDAVNVELCIMHMDLNQDECVGFGINQQQLDVVNEDVTAQLLNDTNGNNVSEKHVLTQRSYSFSHVKDDGRSLKNASAYELYECRSRSFNDLHALKSSGKVLLSEENGYCSRLVSVKGGNVSLPNVSEVVSVTNHHLISVENSEADCASSLRSDHSTKTIDHAKSRTMNEDIVCCENQLREGQDSYMLSSSFNQDGDTIIQETDATNSEQLGNGNEEVDVFEEYPRHWWDGLSPKAFSAKRIEHWVSTIDIQNSSPLEELSECSSTASEIKDPVGISLSAAAGAAAAPTKTSVVPHAVQVANNYISTLTMSCTSAQMANFGLPTIPQLSIFHGLRVINLSGNAVVRITAGLFPKGLHVLNLSRNGISVIEGLRDLTRLRVLDLSYNRILRIGHGLASCPSLKELYLAGNKISEVEGLHRLLKLHILDLSYNKVSTAKCLGQLAANYSSLQVLNLEGNPAQKNVGDDQLKKSLTSLLPHLVYLSRQPVKATSSKEASDRASRSVSMHLSERGMRSDHKIPRKGGHGSSKTSGNALIQAAASSKQSKGHHHGRISSIRSKLTHHQVNIDSRLLGVQPMASSMRRARSEGTMNVL